MLFTVPRLGDLQVDPEAPDFGTLPDGQHFVFALGPIRTSTTTPYNIVLNWFEELNKRR